MEFRLRYNMILLKGNEYADIRRPLPEEFGNGYFLIEFDPNTPLQEWHKKGLRTYGPNY